VWIRFLYGHPESINDSIIKTVAKHDNICSYFDIPVQHVSSPLLKRMGRHYTCDDLRRLYDKIRLLVPDAALRTTVMVGFPGETDKDFEILLNFVKDVGFDHLGVFIYSDSEDLLSHRLSDHVPSNITSDRHNRLMASQAKISLENNRRRIGRIYDVLVEDRHNNNLFAGRTFFQAPEVDGMTFLNFDQMQIGQYASIKITDALEYDLVGQVV
jgi:ribosomal protein S12 methylthiotransferase